ncbi:MAG TPA: MFS transporter [Myxococcaceae bacterium]|nr:MFS transporter [Myxococcaceae bacterium]
MEAAATPSRTLLDMNRYQWTVLLAAWLGWGFDVFDGLLFNYVAPNCVPTLLGLPLGSAEAARETLRWTGLLTSVLLVGWAIGGVIFGRVADRIGRTRTLMLTMALYSLGTSACALAPNIWVLALCRVVASLGIGGEWAAGASMVAEVVPERRRVEAGALLYTSAPIGLFLATFVNFQISGNLFKGSPETSWRYVFLCGLIPAAVAFVVRLFVKEPERWQQAVKHAKPPRIAELFTPQMRHITLSGFSMALTALIMWWSCNAFIPVVAGGLARAAGTPELAEVFKRTATNTFNVGGLLGTLLTIPASKVLGRKWMFGIYFVASAASIMAAFGLDVPPETRLYFYFPIGVFVFGVFGSFTYYLPELFPTRYRGTGAGFCYNIGRLIAAAGPILVGQLAKNLDAAMRALFWVGVVPLLALLVLPYVIETKGRVLAD